jgi:diguanylate cyclase (GGDEF)-like protein
MSLAPSAERFPELFPFHLVVDQVLVIRQLGPALARLLGPGVCGTPLLDQVNWQRPQLLDRSLAGLARLSHKLIVLELQRLPLQLKGQLLVEEHHAFFLGTPVVHSPAQLSSLGIRLGDMATQDALTGVGNRLLFNREFSAELEKHQRCGQALSLLLLDVDHFKQFNDQHGHLVGDSCLRAVAQRLVGLMGRAGDRVYRYGGEEFAVVLPATDLRGGLRVAERIVGAFASAALCLDGASGSVALELSVTVSVGVACADPTSRGPAPQTEMALIALADEAPYQAKHAGRSRFVSLE